MLRARCSKYDSFSSTGPQIVYHVCNETSSEIQSRYSDTFAVIEHIYNSTRHMCKASTSHSIWFPTKEYSPISNLGGDVNIGQQEAYFING